MDPHPHIMPQTAQQEETAAAAGQAMTPRQPSVNLHRDHQVTDHSSVRPLIFTLFVAGVVVGVKLLLVRYSTWKGEVEPADNAILITGLFFILGQMLSNLNADYKEAEKLPSDIASSLEQLDDHFQLCESKVADKGCSHQRDVRPVLLHLAEAILSVMEAKAKNGYAVACYDLQVLMKFSSAWDKKGAANTAPIPATIDKVRRSLSRSRVISRTSALPVGQTLLLFFVFSTTVVLFLTIYKTYASLVVTMVVIFTVTWLLTGAIRSMDDPFDAEGGRPWGVMASVDLFPLSEYIERLRVDIETPLEMPAIASNGIRCLPELIPVTAAIYN